LHASSVKCYHRHHCIRDIGVACCQYEWLPFPSLSHEETPRLDTLFAFPPNEKPPNEGTRARQQRKTAIKHPPPDPRLLTSTESPHRKPSCLTQTRNQYTRLPYHPFVHRREGSSLTIDRHETPSPHHSIHPSNPMKSPEHPRDHTTVTTHTVPEQRRANKPPGAADDGDDNVRPRSQ
jgi:hypothetical protein